MIFVSLVLLLSGVTPNLAIEPPVTLITTPTTIDDGFTTFPCGLSLGNRQLLPSMMVRGKEDGEKAIDFTNWSIPFNVLTQTLKIKTTTLPDGSIELRSSAAVAKIDPSQLTTYPEIGLAIKIKDLQTYLGIKAEFDLNEYTIKVTLPKSLSAGTSGEVNESEIDLDGLELKQPNPLTITAIEQKFNVNGLDEFDRPQGRLAAAGTIFGSSWYAQFDRRGSNLFDLRLSDAQVIKYSDRSDYIIGGQPAFWNRQDTSNYWGVTGIWRQGFTPPTTNTGNISTADRTQSSKVGRTIVGRAAPGTLVQLLPAASDRAVAEVLVDSSGIFRFDRIPVTSADRYYRLWLFANGQLSAAPEVREVNFVTVPGQLPTGATSTLASVGLRRESQGFFGDFQDIRGAIVSHWGVSEWLTLGSGVSFDRGVQGLAELYFQPNGVPLEAAISLKTGEDLDILSNVTWKPDRNVELEWNVDRFAHRVNANWQLSQQLAFQSKYDSQDALSAGFDYRARNSANSYTSLNASYDSKSRIRWRVDQRLGQWNLQNQGSEVGTISNLTYSLNPQQRTTGSALQLTYQTSQVSLANEATTLTWRHRSLDRSDWEAELGYGLGALGGGWIVGGSANIFPGINVRGRYQTGINNASPSFSLELSSNLEFQSNWRESTSQVDRFRTHGGIEIIPFFDRNGNGKQDFGETAYIDPELINLNNRPLKPYRPIIRENSISLQVLPNKYRLDFDPAGFPAEWKPQALGYAVEVAAGSYTQVLVPLMAAYTLEGTIVDRHGKPIAGAKIEAVPAGGGSSTFSITNERGQYVLESLSQGKYQLKAIDFSISPTTIDLQNSQTVNLRAS